MTNGSDSNHKIDSRFHTFETVETELDRLQERKRQVYLIALVCGILILMLSWFIRSPEDAFIKWLYPVFAIILAGLFPFVFKNTALLRRLEIIMLILAGTMIFSRLAWHFLVAENINEQLLMLAGGHYWSVAVLVVGGFVILDHRLGFISGSIVIVLSMIIAASGLASQWHDDLYWRESLIYLMRIHLFLILILVLTSIATTMREKLKSALIRAEILNKWANTDILTGLANRRAAELFIKKQISLTSRHGHPFWIISADLDGFKQVNDTHGHEAGDKILAEVGRILSQTVRQSDLVARWGGEEFLVVATDTADNGAKMLAERCRSAIADEFVAGVRITATLGVAEFKHGDTLENVLAKADSMLYRGKDAGRNRVVVA
jgi:diguanylate cyclase (GGDEF)-like protein